MLSRFPTPARLNKLHTRKHKDKIQNQPVLFDLEKFCIHLFYAEYEQEKFDFHCHYIYVRVSHSQCQCVYVCTPVVNATVYLLSCQFLHMRI